MKTRRLGMRRGLALLVTVLPLSAITTWGLSHVLKPAASTGPKNLVSGSYQLRSRPAVGRLTVSASLTAQSNTGQIGSFFANNCLQPVNESTAQGAAIVQMPCNNSPAQQWRAVSMGGRVFHFVNSLSGLCLDARGGAVNHTPVQQWTCNKITNENWESPEVSDDDIPPLISRVSGTRSYCLDVPGAQKSAGLAVQIYRCNGTVAQIWFTAIS
jgi:Ricin-type beta-trefoil lectin domain